MLKRGIIFLSLCFAFCTSLQAQGKLNELTKSNMSFKKSFSTEAHNRSGDTYRDTNKRFSTDTYYNSDKSYYDKDKRFGTDSYYDADKKASGYGDNYNTPNLREDMGTRSRFYDENKELFLENKSRNLNDDYSGRSDFSKKKNMKDMVDKVYEDLMDRSMSDINKYHSQTAREDSREGGIPISPTGKQEDSSILDLLNFSNKNIENTSVGFTLPKAMSNMRSVPLKEEVNREDIQSYEQGVNPYSSSAYQAPRPQSSGQARTPSPKNPNIPDYSNPNQRHVPAQNTQQSPKEGKKTYTIEKPVDKNAADKSLFGVPKQFNSGKMQITVEVKEK